MIRQTAFGIALSTLVFASGLITAANPGKINTENRENQERHKSSLMTNQTAIKTSVNSVNLQNSQLEISIFNQINQYRIKEGLPQLRLSEEISKQARTHSENMAAGRVNFSHHGFVERVKAIHIKFNSAAENVAFNIGYSNPANEAVSGWIKSPGHLKNIKGQYNLTGIGVAINSQGEVYLTQIFLNGR
ncbi:CAP domain-containing protein [Anabaena sp. FACHB-1237]|uniref:CAP domain-containing protein n=1 Tax=Anabaena sp. FACHB-1237 TaxID=2692769 RepID=UPI00167FF1AE|nr:CAP domain-containing protein [Anabaena sp. FACHB-1237]MBD2139734.1 CAP domain-containing protein [Anabaena sp. FACHB-1237]